MEVTDKIMNGTEPKVLLSRLDTHFWQNLGMVVQSLARELQKQRSFVKIVYPAKYSETEIKPNFFLKIQWRMSLWEIHDYCAER